MSGAEPAGRTREGFKGAVALELSLEESGGLYRWEGMKGDGIQEEGQREPAHQSRWCALQTMAGGLDHGDCSHSGAEVG